MLNSYLLCTEKPFSPTNTNVFHRGVCNYYYFIDKVPCSITGCVIISVSLISPRFHTELMLVAGEQLTAHGISAWGPAAVIREGEPFDWSIPIQPF